MTGGVGETALHFWGEAVRPQAASSDSSVARDHERPAGSGRLELTANEETSKSTFRLAAAAVVNPFSPPIKTQIMKKLIFSILSAAILTLGATSAFAQDEAKGKKGKKKQAATTQGSESAPKTVIHVVTVSWKEGSTPEQIQAALEGVRKLPSQFPGITRVWTKTIKAQGNRTHALVMEFASEQALKDYAGSDAQKEWYKVYEGVREGSTTFDITN